MSDCETQLVEARAALHKLSLGQSVASVEVDGHRVQYTQASRASLVRYVAELEAECGQVPEKKRRRPIQFTG